MRSQFRRLFVTASAVALLACTAAPIAAADPVAKCTSEGVDGVEVDSCMPNSNANTVSDVPGVNVETQLEWGIGIG
jgi:hypothetical protein